MVAASTARGGGGHPPTDTEVCKRIGFDPQRLNLSRPSDRLRANDRFTELSHECARAAQGSPERELIRVGLKKLLEFLNSR